MLSISKKLRIILICLFLCTPSLYASTPKPFTLVLDWYLNPDHAPLFIAQQQGYFKAEGLSVKLITPSDPSDGPKLAAAGKADAAITYQPGFMQQVNQGLPLIRFGSLINKPLACLIVLKTSPIHDLKDLKGKTVGYSNPSADEFILNQMLKYDHLSIEEIQPVNVHYNLNQGLISKRLDAFMGAMRNVEPIELKLAGYPVHRFYPESHGIPPYDELIFVTRSDNIHDPRLLKFLKALKRSIAYLKAHPQSSWKTFAAARPELANEAARQSWLASIPYFSQNPEDLDKQKYTRFTQFLLEEGFIQKAIPLEKYAVRIDLPQKPLAASL